MYNTNLEVLFPSRLIPSLRDLRGDAWQNLVDHVVQQGPVAVDRLAFVLMMIRLGTCTSCHIDSYRAQRGCEHCASRSVSGFRGSDQDLLMMYSEARMEVERFLETGEYT